VFLSAVFGEIPCNNHPKDVSKPDALNSTKRWEMFVPATLNWCNWWNFEASTVSW